MGEKMKLKMDKAQFEHRVVKIQIEMLQTLSFCSKDQGAVSSVKPTKSSEEEENVADVNRMNGLVTDLQMFALKTLQIPLPVRRPPSASLSNGHPSPGYTRLLLHRLTRRSGTVHEWKMLNLKSGAGYRLPVTNIGRKILVR
ncbi:hypothetical protein C5167_003966, partial [Papaver somniferum]